MKDTTFWPSPGQAKRLAKPYKPGKDGGLEETEIYFIKEGLTDHRRTPRPGGGLFSTARDVARFFISALLAELNGDLGTTGTVYLMEGSTVLDQVTGYIGPKGTASVVFSTVFNSLGTHQLQVVVANETPGDYDYSNNTKSFSIEVTQAPARYYAYYSHYIDEHSKEYNYPWWYYSGSNYYNVNDENLSLYLYPAGALTFPLNDVAITTTVDGNPVDSFDWPNLDADYSYPPP